jgi:acetyltransferase-like isoleucine patch superfamily enzyme
MPFVAGCFWPAVRRRIVQQAQGMAHEDGVVRFPGSRVGCDVTLGRHTHLGFNSVVSHGCQIGEFVSIAGGAVLSGEVTVGDGAVIGANAVVIHGGITIGAGAIIGAGAVVVGDIPEGVTVVGNPARPLRKCIDL